MLRGMRIFTRRIIYFYPDLLRRGQWGIKCSSQAYNLGKSSFQRGFFLVGTRAPLRREPCRRGAAGGGYPVGWTDAAFIISEYSLRDKGSKYHPAYHMRWKRPEPTGPAFRETGQKPPPQWAASSRSPSFPRLSSGGFPDAENHSHGRRKGSEALPALPSDTDFK